MQDNSTPSPYPLTEDIWMVPCLIKRSENLFEPICTPFSQEIQLEKLQSRLPWHSEEDEALLQITLQRGVKAWTAIARDLNNRVHQGLPVRLGKQCRERYYNHLDPSLKKDKWTNEEDLYILKKQKEMGNKWSEIARDLSGRTENQIKNRFKSMLKKALKAVPKDTDPVQFLIKQKNGEEIEIPKAEKLPSPLTNRFTPPTTFSLGDMGFSAIADRIKFSGTVYQPKQEATPSPSTMLFFHEHSQF